MIYEEISHVLPPYLERQILQITKNNSFPWFFLPDITYNGVENRINSYGFFHMVSHVNDKESFHPLMQELCKKEHEVITSCSFLHNSCIKG